MTGCTHESCAELAHRWNAREIVRGNLKDWYDDLAVYLAVWTGHWHTRGMVARILDDEARRDSRAREGPKERPPDGRSEG